MAKKKSEKPKVEIPEGLDVNAVHIFAKRGITRDLVAVNPYLRFSKGGKDEDGNSRKEVVLLQHGKFYNESGVEYSAKDLPAWVADQLKKASPEALEECGLRAA